MDTALETVGQDLRAARLRRGDDLATVSKALKIRKDHLEALEEDRIEALPGRTYAVGFVRTYSDYLGLDPIQCVERYKAEIAGRTEEREPPPYPDETEERHLPYGWMVVGVIVLVLVIYGAYHLAISADTVANQPVADVPTQLVPKQETAQVAPQQQPAAPAAVAPTTTTNPQAVAPGQQDATATPPAATAAPAPIPVGHVYGEANSSARVVLRVTEATKILVLGPGHKVFINRVLQPGDTYRVPNVVGTTLTTPNGGAVEIDLDGQAMGHGGGKGQMADAVSLDPQSVVDRYGSGRAG
ncbi:MAG TPA: RodZ domain-containing protein [Rhizomicrobium sp.]|jgi:cytoskeleton protein RodZ|nr:RodZ domain-containing protein [Rhizomicrobium sp.]